MIPIHIPENIINCSQSPRKIHEDGYIPIFPLVLINPTRMVLHDSSKVGITLSAFFTEVIIIQICFASSVPACNIGIFSNLHSYPLSDLFPFPKFIFDILKPFPPHHPFPTPLYFSKMSPSLPPNISPYLIYFRTYLYTVYRLFQKIR